MCISTFIWLICFVTVGDSYSDNKVLETSVDEQQVNLNGQVLKNTITVHGFKRGNVHETSGFSEEQKLRLLQELKRSKYSEGLTMLEECGNPKQIYTCFKYPPNYLENLKKEQGDILKLGTFPTTQYKDLAYNKRGPTLNLRKKIHKLSACTAEFNDPLWHRQWYMQDHRTSDGPVMDSSVCPVYKLGYTGKGVKIAVVDSGVDVAHEDLKGNNLEDMNYNYCYDTKDCNMMKEKKGRIEVDDEHGTEVAGVICMIANNKKGGVGYAYDAKFAGIRYECESIEILNEHHPTTATSEEEEMKQMTHTFYSLTAKALTHVLDEFDIYNNSWGPEDSPKMLEPINPLVNEALNKGIREGRKGKGAIYIFAVGNGKEDGDNCSYDCYINHVGTIGVASANEDGSPTHYSEKCTSVFTTAYGGNQNLYRWRILTTDPKNKYENYFYGTSASAPMVSGIIALALEANSELTYRDVMHLIARSSEVAPLANNRNTWMKNAAGFWVSPDFGFGLLNAERMVSQALKWKTVPELEVCTITVNVPKDKTLSVFRRIFFTFDLKECSKVNNFGRINYIEQVTLAPHINYPARGAVTIYLTSPKGTKSTLVDGRSKDLSAEGFLGHVFKSVHFWGEDPEGKWTIEISTSVLWRRPHAMFLGKNKIEKIDVTFYGTFEPPALEARTYDAFRLPNHVEQL